MDAMDRLTSRWSVSWRKPDEADQIERYYDGLEGLSRSVGQAHLLGDSALIAACVRAQRHWDLEMQAALRLKDTRRLMKGYPIANELYNDVVREARAELDRPKAPLSARDAAKLAEERQTAREAAGSDADSQGEPSPIQFCVASHDIR